MDVEFPADSNNRWEVPCFHVLRTMWLVDMMSRCTTIFMHFYLGVGGVYFSSFLRHL